MTPSEASTLPNTSTGTDSHPFPKSTAQATPETTPAGGVAAATLASNEVLERIVQGAHQTIDRLAGVAAPQVQKLQEGVTVANDKLHQRADEMRELGSEWTESLRCTVRENPLAAIATALAVGILIARLSR